MPPCNALCWSTEELVRVMLTHSLANDPLGDDVSLTRAGLPPRAPATGTNIVLLAYERYGRTLYGFICRIVTSAPDAEDILQECFTRALTSFHCHPDCDDAEGLLYCRRWLFQVATHLSLDLLRKRKRQPQTIEHGDAGYGGYGADGGQDERHALALVEPGPTLQDRVAQHLLLDETFKRMRPADVSVLLLFEHSGFALSEIAVIAGCSPAAAAKKVARARHRFVRVYQQIAREEVGR